MTDNNENLPRIYLAGPDVFHPKARERGDELKKKLAEFGLQGVYPLDALYPEESTKLQVGYSIYKKNIELLKSCVGVLANITPFRSPSADVGTAFEMGYATSMGIPIVCYTFDIRKYKARVSQDGNAIEDFDMVDNLMLHGATSGDIYDAEMLSSALLVLKKKVLSFLGTRGPAAKRMEELRTELELEKARMHAVSSELFGDPKLNPENSNDPRWSAALQRAATLREQRDRLAKQNGEDDMNLRMDKIDLNTARITIDRLQSENAQLHLRVNGLREELDRLNADYEVCKDERDRRRIAAHRAGRDDALIPDPSSWKNSEGHTCGLLLRWFDGSGNPRTVIADHSAVRAWLAHVSKENREAALRDYIPSQKQADTWMQERDELIARDQRAERLIERYSKHLDTVLRLASGIPVAQEENEHASVHALRQLLDKTNKLEADAERPWQSVESTQRAKANEEDLSRILDLASGCQVPKAPVEHAAVVAVRNMITRNNIDLDDRAITINTLRDQAEAQHKKLEELKAQKRADIVFGTFEWAILQLMRRHAVRRAEWFPGVRVEKSTRSVRLVILQMGLHGEGGEVREWSPREEDLKAKDYMAA